jgi:predicted HNH restriction endonuclease
MFITATNKDELFLLGVIGIEKSGKGWSSGKSKFGAFQILPLKAVKWKLRFKSLDSPQLSKESKVSDQVRARRLLTLESARLLVGLLSKDKTRRQQQYKAQEGRLREFRLLKRERDPKVRAIALAERGTVCEICTFDFAEVFGEFAANCVEVHHIKLLANARNSGTVTSVDDVIVICPNCHRALHRYKNPENLKGFKAYCEFA